MMPDIIRVAGGSQKSNRQNDKDSVTPIVRGKFNWGGGNMEISWTLNQRETCYFAFSLLFTQVNDGVKCVLVGWLDGAC